MSEQIKMAGRDIKVSQMNMAQIREVVAAMEKDSADKETKPHILDLVFDDDVPARAVSVATGLSMDELGGKFSQDECRKLLDLVKAANPFYVGMMERFIKAGQQLKKD